MLDADRQAHIAVGDAGRELLLGRELRVRGRGRMDRQAARVADVGDVVEQLQRVDEAARRPRAPPSSSKPTSPPIAALEVGLGAALAPRPSCMRRDRSPASPAGCVAPGSSATACGVAAVLAHAQRQRLQPLDEQEGVERAHRRAEVAQQRDARLDDVGDRPERLHRLRSTPRRDSSGPAGSASGSASACFSQSKLPPSTMHAADRGAVAADILGRRVDDDGGAVVERPAEHRRRRVVHDQRHAELVADRRHLARSGRRRASGWAASRRSRRACVSSVARRNASGSAGSTKRTSMPMVLQRVGEQVPGAAVEVGRADDVVAGPRDVLDREGRGRLARRQRERRHAALERGDALLQHVAASGS